MSKLNNNTGVKSKVNYFTENGFVVLKNVISIKEIKNLLIEIEKIKKQVLKTNNKRFYHLTKNKKINTIHNIQKFYKSDVLKKLSNNIFIQNFLKNALSKKNLVRNYEFFLKPAKTGMASPIHQDNFYWNIKKGRAVNAWIALGKADRSNGGIFYLKGSHKAGVIEHEPSFMKGTSQTIPKKKITKKFKKFYPTLRKGDCLIHHCEVMHGSNQNLSNMSRKGIAISYKSFDAKIDMKKKQIYEKKLKENTKNIYQF